MALSGLENFTAMEQHLYEYVDNQVGTRPLDAQTDNQATTALESYVASVRARGPVFWTLLLARGVPHARSNMPSACHCMFGERLHEMQQKSPCQASGDPC